MNIETWKREATELVRENQVAGLLLAAGLNSYLRHTVTGIQPTGIIHLHGASSTGKTLTAEAVLSMTMNVRSRINELTYIGLQRLLIERNGEPVFIDEVAGFAYRSSGGKADLLEQLIYIANGGGERANTQPTWSWRNTVFTAGNQSLMCLLNSEDKLRLAALNDRVIEIDMAPYTQLKSFSKLSSFYGKRLDTSIASEVLSTYNDASLGLAAAYSIGLENQFAEYSLILPKTKRKARELALMACGIHLMKQILGLNEADINLLQEAMASIVSQQVEKARS